MSRRSFTVDLPQMICLKHLLNFSAPGIEVVRQPHFSLKYAQPAMGGPGFGVWRDDHNRLAGISDGHRLATRQDLLHHPRQVGLGVMNVHGLLRLRHGTWFPHSSSRGTKQRPRGESLPWVLLRAWLRVWLRALGRLPRPGMVWPCRPSKAIGFDRVSAGPFTDLRRLPRC